MTTSKKKMPIQNSAQLATHRHKVNVIDFIPATLKETKSEGFLIEYHFRNPLTDTMERRRSYVNKIVKAYKRKSDGIRHAQRIVCEINDKLMNGWMPIFKTEDQRLYTPILKVRDLYLADKEKSLRHATYIAYSSLTKMFADWIRETKREKLVSGSFLRQQAVAYMDYVLNRGFSNRYYNNNLKAMRTFFAWCVEHCYCNENPFESIKVRPNEDKKRILIDENTRQRVYDYLKENNRQMLVVCKLIYNSAIRPNEAHNIMIRDINLEKRHIVITKESAKNHKERYATLTQDLIDDISKVISGKPADWYLFGGGRSKLMLPSKKQVCGSKFRKIWSDVRVALKLPEEMQLYSYRDTGMVDLFHAGVDELSIQQHFDHSSLAMEAIYTKHFDPKLNERIYQNAPEFCKNK